MDPYCLVFCLALPAKCWTSRAELREGTVQLACVGPWGAVFLPAITARESNYTGLTSTDYCVLASGGAVSSPCRLGIETEPSSGSGKKCLTRKIDFPLSYKGEACVADAHSVTWRDVSRRDVT